MIFYAVERRTRARTAFELVGSHTSTVRLGETPAKWPGCCGCHPAQVGRNPKGEDPQGLRAEHEHAVGGEADDAPKTPSETQGN